MVLTLAGDDAKIPTNIKRDDETKYALDTSPRELSVAARQWE